MYAETASHRPFSLYLSILRQSAVGKHKFFLQMMQAEKSHDQFESFYGMTRFAVNNTSFSKLCIIWDTVASYFYLTSPN